MSVYVEADDEEEKNQVLGNLEKGITLKLEELKPSQHFTQPPAHYTAVSYTHLDVYKRQLYDHNDRKL